MQQDTDKILYQNQDLTPSSRCYQGVRDVSFVGCGNKLIFDGQGDPKWQYMTATFYENFPMIGTSLTSKKP